MQSPKPRPSNRFAMRKVSSSVALAAAAAASLSSVQSASAVTTNWTAGGNGTWGTATNWDAGTPTINDDAYFNSSTLPQPAVNETITISTTTAAATKLFFYNPGSTTINGTALAGGLSLRGGIYVDAGAGPVTISGTSASTMNLNGSSQSWVNNSLNAVTMPPASTPGSGQSITLTLDGTGLLGVTGAIANGSGTGSMVAIAKSGTGTWQIPNSTYTGGFTLNNGTILIAGSNAFGNSTANANKKLTINGGSIGAVGTIDRTIPAAVPVFVNANFGINNTSTALHRANFAGTVNLGNATRTITVGIEGTDWTGVVSNGGLVKEGPGVMVLGSNAVASNSLSGNLPVNAGGLVLANTGAVANYLSGNVVLASGTFFGARLGSDSAMTVADVDAIRDNASLFDAPNKDFAIDVTLAGTTVTSGTPPVDVVTPITYSGVIGNVNGSRGFVKTSSGGLILTGNNTYSGNTTLNGGSLQVSSQSNLGDGSATNNLAWTNSATLITGAALGNVAKTVTINRGTATVNTNGFDSELSGAFSGAGNLLKLGAGNLTLSADNSAYTGAITIGIGGADDASTTSGGVLRITNAKALGSAAVGTTITGNTNANNLSALALAGDIAVAEPITVQGKSATVNPSPSIINASGNNSLTVPVTMSAGATWYSFQSDAGKLTLAGINNATNATARTIRLLGAGQGEVAGPIQNTNGATGAVSLRKEDAGTWTLSGVNTYTGGTTVNAGTLVVGNADATAGGAIDVKDGALAQAQASLPKAVTVTTLNTNATGKFDLTNNSMVIKGMADSAVRTQLQAGYNAGAWNGPTGIVSTSITPETSIGYATKLQTGITDFKGVTGMADTDVQVKFTYAGDANLDGKVDIGDLGLLAGAWQAASGKVWFDGDFTYDGAVDIGDLGLLSGNWQKGTAGNPNPPLMDFSTAMAQFSAFDGVVVPEPTSLGLLGVAGIGLLARRRRR